MKIPPNHFDAFRLKGTLARLTALLRIAVLLYRGRTREAVPVPTIKMGSEKISLQFEVEWLDEHALTLHDLKREQEILNRIGIKLRFK